MGLDSRGTDEGGRCCRFFPVAQLAVEFFHFQRAGRDLVELLGVGAVGAFDGAVEFGRARGKHEQVQTALLASLFELGGELEPPSTCTARMGKGMRCSRVSKNWLAA